MRAVVAGHLRDVVNGRRLADYLDARLDRRSRIGVEGEQCRRVPVGAGETAVTEHPDIDHSRRRENPTVGMPHVERETQRARVGARDLQGVHRK